MVNKCKVEMKRRELYNVVEPLKEGDGRIVRGTKEIKKETGEILLNVLSSSLSVNSILHAYDLVFSLKPSSLTHPLQIFIVGCTLGQGLINGSWARKIVQLQLAPSVGRTKASASATVEHGRTRSAPGGSSPS